ncbi:IS110 family transposase [Geminicoccaceae bacterium 1502E]|nr:IS110 family transposase [Geminicoccaceae bacterium 1502E]
MAGWLEPVSVRSLASHQRKSLLVARATLVRTRLRLSNRIRGLLKPFGLRLGRVPAGRLEQKVRELAADRPVLLAALEPLLAIRGRLIVEIGRLDGKLLASARDDAVVRRLMTIPGVGALTARAFTAVVDDPRRFKRSSDLGAYPGLVPRRWPSGQQGQSGRITRCGDGMLRHLLYECANTILAILKKPCALKAWAEALAARIGARKARVALARKLATLMHRLWVREETFAWPETRSGSAARAASERPSAHACKAAQTATGRPPKRGSGAARVMCRGGPADQAGDLARTLPRPPG